MATITFSDLVDRIAAASPDLKPVARALAALAFDMPPPPAELRKAWVRAVDVLVSLDDAAEESNHPLDYLTREGIRLLVGIAALRFEATVYDSRGTTRRYDFRAQAAHVMRTFPRHAARRFGGRLSETESVLLTAAHILEARGLRATPLMTALDAYLDVTGHRSSTGNVLSLGRTLSRARVKAKRALPTRARPSPATRTRSGVGHRQPSDAMNPNLAGALGWVLDHPSISPLLTKRELPRAPSSTGPDAESIEAFRAALEAEEMAPRPRPKPAAPAPPESDDSYDVSDLLDVLGDRAGELETLEPAVAYWLSDE